MRLCFGITILLAFAGLVYNGFSAESRLSFLYISASASPLLFCSFGIEQVESRVEARAVSWLAPLRWAFLALAVLNVLVFIYASGFRVQDLFSTAGIIALAQQATTERYEFGGSSGNAFLVAAAFINSFLWSSSRASLVVSASVALAPPAVYAILSTEKWPFYCALSFFFTGVLLTRGSDGSARPTWRVAGMFALIGFVVGLLSLAARQGLDESGFSQNAVTALLGTLSHYMFAQYQAFGEWLVGHYSECCSLGANTFIGPASLIGMVERHEGVFLESVVVNGQETNIYTAWRYLVQDFSVLGPVILIFVWAIAYRYCVLAGRTRVAAAMHVVLMTCTLLQVNTTIFVHNSVALATFACAAMFAGAVRMPNESSRVR